MWNLGKLLLLLTLACTVMAGVSTSAWAADDPAAPGHGGTASSHAEGAAGSGGGSASSHRESLLTSLWVLIIFIVMLMILYPTAWRNIVVGLKKREERIRNDIAEAEAAQAAAEAALKERSAQLAAAEARTRELLAAAEAQGVKLAEQIRNRAQQEAEEIRQRTTRDIKAAGQAAVQSIRNEAANLSTTVAEKIVRRNMNDTDQAELLSKGLEQLQTVGRN